MRKVLMKKRTIIILMSILVLLSIIVTSIYIRNDNKIAVLGYHAVLP